MTDKSMTEEIAEDLKHRLLVQGARLILQGLGVDLDSHNFAATPERMAKVYEELFNPPDTGWPVFNEDYTDIVVMRGFEFYTLCPHHMLPVRIRASVGYKPNGKVIGASKLVRLILECNRKPETQEKLTQLVCDAIKHYTQNTSLGEAVFMEGEHGCMKIRGIRAAGADMVTWKFGGQFHEDAELQRRFFELVRR